MPPQTTESPSSVHEPVSNSQTCAWYAPLCKVTSTSKILAAIVFIILPFVGAYVGYKMAGNMASTSDEATIIDVTPTKVSATGHTLRYIYDAEWSEYLADQENFSRIKTLDNVNIATGQESLKDIGQAPYFVQLLAENNEYMIFCRLPFEKGGSCNGLFKYMKTDSTFSEMTTSGLYNPFSSGGVLSPDQTKIALAPYDSADNTGEIIGYIDLTTDTYTALKSVDDHDKSFIICGEMSCGSEITWLGNNNFEVNVYESCVAFNECLVDAEEPRVPKEVVTITTLIHSDDIFTVTIVGGDTIDYTNAAPNCSIYDKDIYTIVFGDEATAKADCKGFGNHLYKEAGVYTVQYMRNQDVVAEKVITVVK